MNTYIKINENDEITDLFFEFQKEKFDGTEIFFADMLELKINGKSISSEYGFPIFNYVGGNAVAKTQTEIDSNAEFITMYKKLKKDELQFYIGLHQLDILVNHTWEEIVIRWVQFRNNSNSWTTKQEIDNAFDTAITWLNS